MPSLIPDVTTGDTPSPRESHAAWFWSDKLYIFGGFDGATVVNDLHMFDIPNKNWVRLEKEVSGYIPIPRAGHRAVVIDDMVYVHGGADPVRRFADVVRLDMNTLQWTLFDCTRGDVVEPEPRYFHTLTQIPETTKALLFGGNSGRKILNDLIVFDPKNRSWSSTSTEGAAPPCLHAHSAAFINDCAMLVWGGMTEKNRPTYEMHLLDTTVWVWTTPVISSGKVMPSAGQAGVAAGGCVLSFGGVARRNGEGSEGLRTIMGAVAEGEGEHVINSFSKVDLDGQSSAIVRTKTPLRGRQRHTMTLCQGLTAVIFGGHDGVQVSGETFIIDLGHLLQSPTLLATQKRSSVAQMLGFDVMTDVVKPKVEDEDATANVGERRGRGRGSIFDLGGGGGGMTSVEAQALAKAETDKAKAEMMDSLTTMNKQYMAELTMARGDIAKLVVTTEIMKREIVQLRDTVNKLNHDNKKLKDHARRQSVDGRASFRKEVTIAGNGGRAAIGENYAAVGDDESSPRYSDE